jgi:DNA-binding phage protein
MSRVKDQKEVFNGMLLELEQAIKEFMRVAKERGMSKAEIDRFLRNNCGTTLDEVCKNKVVH